ncbi:hypothetical protein [Campylobacter sp. MG1]|uniref:hypothetical protein n=1 Tax=Campylobacter sp. MG1 TaxID=2976332 RepID=UPI00226CD3CA|nr:hypothetical protein [Campylobacter sp. MG1]
MQIFGLDYINNLFNSYKFTFTNEPDKINCLKFSKENLIKTNIKKAIFCENLNEVLLCNAALVEYIIPNKNILTNSTELAQKYLFDSKILCFIENTNNLYLAAEYNVDCVLFLNFDENLKQYFIK